MYSPEQFEELGKKNNLACWQLGLYDSSAYDLSDCWDYGCSDCPVTMDEDRPCNITREELEEGFTWKWKSY